LFLLCKFTAKGAEVGLDEVHNDSNDRLGRFLRIWPNNLLPVFIISWWIMLSLYGAWQPVRILPVSIAVLSSVLMFLCFRYPWKSPFYGRWLFFLSWTGAFVGFLSSFHVVSAYLLTLILFFMVDRFLYKASMLSTNESEFRKTELDRLEATFLPNFLVSEKSFKDTPKIAWAIPTVTLALILGSVGLGESIVEVVLVHVVFVFLLFFCSKKVGLSSLKI